MTPRATSTRTSSPRETTEVADRSRASVRPGQAGRLRLLLVCGALVAAAVGLSVASLITGSLEITIGEVVRTLLGGDTGFTRIVVMEWRLPRAIAAVACGAALGAAGAVFQSLTRNPLASPDIIGFTMGAQTGALLIAVLLGAGFVSVSAGALAGGIGIAVVVYLLAWRDGIHGVRLIVTGVAISAMLAAANTWLMLRSDLDVAITAAIFNAGTLAGITLAEALWVSLVTAVLLAGLTLTGPGMRQLELGDDTARTHGTRVESTRLAAIGIAVALTAAVTAVAGPIVFIALAAPQIGRRLTHTAGICLPAAAFTGALLLALADYTAQHLLPTETPVGLVTLALGGGYLLWLLAHQRRRHL